MLAVLLYCYGCARNPSDGSLRRIALLPSNVLIADSSSDWLRLAVPLVLEQDLSTSSAAVAALASDDSAAYQLGSTELLRTTVEQRSRQLTVDVNLIDLATQQNRKVISSRGPAAQLIPQLNALAKQFDKQASPFSTKSEPALRALAKGLSTSNPQLKSQALRDAIASDPSFGLAYFVLAETLLSNKAEVQTVLDSAAARNKDFTELDRSRLNLLRKQVSHAPVEDLVVAAKALATNSPNNVEALATLGSNLFLLGDTSSAEPAFNRALQVNPANASLRQQLAIGLIETKQYAKAEQILTNLAAANPAVLPALSVCVLLEGDGKRADVVYEKFLSSVTNPDAKTFYRATWLALEDRLTEAIAQLQKASFTDPRARGLASRQVSIWQQMAGHAPSPADGSAYALFLNRSYKEAAQAWAAIDKQSGHADLRARAMLAGSLSLAGNAAAARQVPVQPFVPDLNDAYAAVSFRELRRLLKGQTG